MVDNRKRDRFMAYHRIRTVAVLFAVILLTAACGGGTSSTAGTSSGEDTGSLKFSIIVADETASNTVSPGMAAVDCDRMNIDTVIAELRDSSNNLIATGGPWPCSTRQGTLTAIPAGEGYTLIIYMYDSLGNLKYQGFIYGITVPAAGTADAGTVTVTPQNNPPVITEISGETRITGGSGTMQLEVVASDPDGDNLTYYMSDLPRSRETGDYFSGASFDPDRHYFLWNVTEDYEEGEYFVWFIVTDDGIPRRSAWKRCKIYIDSATSATPDTQLVLNTDDDSAEVVGRKYADAGSTFTMQLKDTSETEHEGLSFSMTPELGALGETTGLFTWTPGSGDTGNWTLAFLVQGSGWVADGKKILLTVGNGNVCPLVEPLGTRRVMKVKELYEFYVTAEDPDSENLTFTALGGGDDYLSPFDYGATFDTSTQTFSWEPPSSGTFLVTFTATDRSGASDFWAMLIDVTE